MRIEAGLRADQPVQEEAADRFDGLIGLTKIGFGGLGY